MSNYAAVDKMTGITQGVIGLSAAGTSKLTCRVDKETEAESSAEGTSNKIAQHAAKRSAGSPSERPPSAPGAVDREGR